MIIGVRLLLLLGLLFMGYFLRNSVKRDNKPLLIVALLFGGGAGIAALILNTVAQHVFNFPDTIDPRVHSTTSQIVISTAVFVIIEELTKFVPLALFLMRKKYFNMLSDGVLYFGVAGIAFGSLEHILYGGSFGEITLLVRIFLVLFLHAGLTGMVGYFYAKDRVIGNRFRTLFALLSAMSLHYIYNLSLFMSARIHNTWAVIGLVILSGLIATGLNCLLVWLFYVASQRDWKRMSSLEIRPAHELATTEHPQ